MTINQSPCQGVDKYSRIIWDYLHVNHELHGADLILVLGSHDQRVAEWASEVFRNRLAPLIFVSGGRGKITKDQSLSEAEAFKGVLKTKGISPNSILIEDKSTNTGENIVNTKKLLKSRGVKVNKIIIVTKPYKERRDYATALKQWRGVQFQITSPRLTYDEYFDTYPRFGLTRQEAIALMVGDLQRIKEYPKLGFQIPQDMPDGVWEAFQALVKLGYTKHLIKPS